MTSQSNSKKEQNYEEADYKNVYLLILNWKQWAIMTTKINSFFFGWLSQIVTHISTKLRLFLAVYSVRGV